ARLGDADARRWLVERVARRKGADRGLAVEIVGELGVGEALPALLEALGDRKDPFRGACLRVLGMLGDQAHRELIEKALFDTTEEVEVRMDAAEGLMNLGGPEARAALERALGGTDDEELREVVSEAIAQLDLTKGDGQGGVE
ncbi:MAG TPA: PBS lyase, partial [Myxococcales bacterium]|nr:PBS lyase [Myxococcales bacterium]